MTRELLTAASAMALVLALAGAPSVSAQTAPTTPGATEQQTSPPGAADQQASPSATEERADPAPITGEQPDGSVLSQDLRGSPVQNMEGEDMAKVDNLVLSEDGQATHVVISFGGFLGFGAKQVMLPWDRFDLDRTEGILRLAMTKEEVEELPEFRSLADIERERAREAGRTQ